MAKTIMIQGTMSNAGKSLLAAGLCRIFHQDGYRVAPFKSQNMALNSFITSEGLEMGRAQVMQAEAAGIEPSVLMNPILLKPTNDVGSQVIVNGEVLGTMSARDYFKYKKKLVPDIMKAFHKLAEENDIIVIEGAGSPAEINLKSEDIVNMGMAKMAKAPVLLAGDIDRGGVFAQLYGTVELLEEDERKMIFFMKIRPCNICKIKLCICQLPHKEIGQSLFSAGSDQQIRVRNTCCIQIPRNRVLRNFLRIQSSISCILCKFTHSTGDLIAASIIQCNLKI